MNRNEFLKKGACICSAMLLGGTCAAEGIEEDERKEEKKEEKKQADARQAFVSNWTEHLMTVLDANLDEKERRAVMEGCGRGCAVRGFQPYIDRCKGEVETLNAMMRAQWAEAVEHDEDAGRIRIVGKKSDACSCLMVQGKRTLPSPTFCLCSMGWMKEAYGQVTGAHVEVELEETILRGGERCTFRITLS